MNEFEKDKRIQEELKNFKQRILAAQEEAFDEMIHSRTPYLEQDTYANVEYRVDEAVQSLLAGNFTVDGDYLRIEQGGFYIRVQVTTYQWDCLRKELIKLMPKCPKDLEIESLKEQLKRAYD